MTSFRLSRAVSTAPISDLCCSGFWTDCAGPINMLCYRLYWQLRRRDTLIFLSLLHRNICCCQILCFHHQSQQILSAKLAKRGTEYDGYFVTEVYCLYQPNPNINREKNEDTTSRPGGLGGIFWFSQQTARNFCLISSFLLLGSQKRKKIIELITLLDLLSLSLHEIWIWGIPTLPG